MGGDQVRLKWPNDILNGKKKLGGVLAELKSNADRKNQLVVGIGVNVTNSAALEHALRTSAADGISCLQECLPVVPSRSEIAARLIENSIQCLQEFDEDGLAKFLPRWNEFDALAGQQIRIDTPNGQISGCAEGIDANGALRIRTGEGILAVSKGTLSPTRSWARAV
jgi:BirA family biotin operon repressor/biotin-[acetyl-CoA-carboxylase] ligase